jgi:phospholipid/cholesterol/gamma-HCH transport system substrate-binding protein
MGKELEMKKDSLARELRMEIVVGAFMVFVLVGLGYFTIILSGEKWFGTKHLMEVRFKDVMGLKEGDSVVVRGMPVGKVKSLTLEPSPINSVRVTAMLDQPVVVRMGGKITVVATSVLGGRYLQIDEGPEANPKLPENTIFEGQQPYDLVGDASETINAVKQGLIQGGVISNLQSMTAQFNEIATRVNGGKGMLGKLFSEDDTLYNDLSAAATSLKNITAKLDKGEGALGKLMSNDDTVYKDLSAAAASLKNISAGIERGEGLLGKLVKDDSLYEKVSSTIDEVRATVDDYRETAPVVTFTSIFFGAL